MITKKTETFENVMGSMLVIKDGNLFPSTREFLEKNLEFDIYREAKGRDLICYYLDGGHIDEIEHLKTLVPFSVLGIKIANNPRKVVMSRVLPEYLPKFQMTWKKFYEEYYSIPVEEHDSSEYEYSEGGGIYEHSRSVNEMRTNGYC